MSTIDRIKRAIKPLLPPVVLRWRARHWELRQKQERVREMDRLFAGMSPAQVFSLIYERSMWGTGKPGGFFSGDGSHDPKIVATYVKAVSEFLCALPRKPDVVDIGCGDFNVGMHLRPYCNNYVACDVVEALVERNSATFAGLGVDFRCVDITAQDVPAGDVVFVRQVLQHLSNTQISAFLERLPDCAFLVVTEHHPKARRFPPIVTSRSELIPEWTGTSELLAG